MSIRFSCGTCGKVFRVQDVHAGRKGKCPACGSVLQIPPLQEGPETNASSSLSSLSTQDGNVAATSDHRYCVFCREHLAEDDYAYFVCFSKPQPGKKAAAMLGGGIGALVYGFYRALRPGGEARLFEFARCRDCKEKSELAESRILRGLRWGAGAGLALGIAAFVAIVSIKSDFRSNSTLGHMLGFLLLFCFVGLVLGMLIGATAAADSVRRARRKISWESECVRGFPEVKELMEQGWKSEDVKLRSAAELRKWRQYRPRTIWCKEAGSPEYQVHGGLVSERGTGVPSPTAAENAPIVSTVARQRRFPLDRQWKLDIYDNRAVVSLPDGSKAISFPNDVEQYGFPWPFMSSVNFWVVESSERYRFVVEKEAIRRLKALVAAPS
ncbi:MAG: hypothetical protein MUP47_06570 [Phycisphaerae bacterium]|nr:hypothetical protein [Phycisphaerae bacterium]